MKKTLVTLIAAAFAALTVTSFAQVAGPNGGAPVAPVQGGGHAGGGIKKLNAALEKLSLTPAQTTQIKALEAKVGADRKLIAGKVKAGTETKEQARPEMMALGKNFREGIMKILTPAQKKELAATMKAERGAKKGTKGAAGTPPTP